MSQTNLPGINVANHSNLGKGFEKEIEAVNDWYRLQRIADIRKIPHNWSFISFNDYQRQQGRHNPSMFAKTDDGRFMQRVKSDVDFIGGGEGFAIAFDCKETSEMRFPLKNIEPHQLHKLRDRDRCRIISGIMLRFTKTNQVFWLPFKFLAKSVEEMERATIGRRAKPGTASLTITDCEMSGVLIKPNKINSLLDYLQVISIV